MLRNPHMFAINPRLFYDACFSSGLRENPWVCSTSVQAVVVACGDRETAGMIDRVVNTEAGRRSGDFPMIAGLVN